MVAFIVFMERAQRRIPVQYAKRVVGRKVYGGQSTYLPLRVNTGGVIPVIFATSMIALPATIGADGPERRGCRRSPTSSRGASRSTTCSTSSAIIFFSYFYISIIFNPIDPAENMRKYGGFIPGIRPGKRPPSTSTGS